MLSLAKGLPNNVEHQCVLLGGARLAKDPRERADQLAADPLKERVNGDRLGVDYECVVQTQRLQSEGDRGVAEQPHCLDARLRTQEQLAEVAGGLHQKPEQSHHQRVELRVGAGDKTDHLLEEV